MAGATFIDTLRRNWVGMIGWGLGMAALGVLLMSVLSNAEILEQYAEILEAFPPVLTNLMGLTSAAALGSPEGFVGFAFFTYGILIMAVYAVNAGAAITINDEDDGILDVVLSLPLSRWRLILESFAAHVLLAVGVVLIAFGGLLVGSVLANVEIDLGRLLETSIAMIPAILFILGLTVFFGGLLRSKGLAIGIVAGIIVASWFLDFLGAAASETILGELRVLSLFTYFDAEATVTNGANIGHMLVLLVVTGVLVAGSLWAFDRRDIGA